MESEERQADQCDKSSSVIAYAESRMTLLTTTMPILKTIVGLIELTSPSEAEAHIPDCNR